MSGKSQSWLRQNLVPSFLTRNENETLLIVAKLYGETFQFFFILSVFCLISLLCPINFFRDYIFRIIRPEEFLRKGVLKICSKFYLFLRTALEGCFCILQFPVSLTQGVSEKRKFQWLGIISSQYNQ